MIEGRHLCKPRGRVRLLVQTADTEAVEVEVLLKDPPPLVPPKVLVDVADADLSEVGGAPRRLAPHLDARPEKFDLCGGLARVVQYRGAKVKSVTKQSLSIITNLESTKVMILFEVFLKPPQNC